jgi:hypothetical protein
VDLIHTAGASRWSLKMKRMGGIVMIKATATAFAAELHRLGLTMDAFFTVQGEASSTSSQLDSSLLHFLSILG